MRIALICRHFAGILTVIASEAKQSSFDEPGQKAGLLRRFAPRNDG
jgi:hypothetical protein